MSAACAVFGRSARAASNTTLSGRRRARTPQSVLNEPLKIPCPPPRTAWRYTARSARPPGDPHPLPSKHCLFGYAPRFRAATRCASECRQHSLHHAMHHRLLLDVQLLSCLVLSPVNPSSLRPELRE